jgi:hypothetical protein
MKAISPRWIVVALACIGGPAARAADAVPPPPRGEVQLEASAVDEKLANEPFVKRTVIDDKRNHIEELRVRGQLQKVTVAPKDGAPSYEIITGDGSRDLSPGVNTSRGAAGQRVWNVLHF